MPLNKHWGQREGSRHQEETETDEEQVSKERERERERERDLHSVSHSHVLRDGYRWVGGGLNGVIV